MKVYAISFVFNKEGDKLNNSWRGIKMVCADGLEVARERVAESLRKEFGAVAADSMKIDLDISMDASEVYEALTHVPKTKKFDDKIKKL